MGKGLERSRIANRQQVLRGKTEQKLLVSAACSNKLMIHAFTPPERITTCPRQPEQARAIQLGVLPKSNFNNFRIKSPGFSLNGVSVNNNPRRSQQERNIAEVSPIQHRFQFCTCRCNVLRRSRHILIGITFCHRC